MWNSVVARSGTRSFTLLATSSAAAREPQERSLGITKDVVDVPFGRFGWKGHGSNPRGRVLRCVLLEEGEAVDPVRIALHRERAVADGRHDASGHALEVRDEVSL